MRKPIIYFLSFILAGSLLTGCGSSSKNTESYATAAAPAGAAYAYDYATDDIYEYEAEEALYDTADGGSAAAGAGNNEIVSKNRKIIKTVNISAETEEFDVLMENISKKVEALGGYLSNTNISGRSLNERSGSNRHAELTARIPAKNLPDFLNHINEVSNITYKTESAEDVTLNYADTEAKIGSLRTEQQRLNELIATAQDIDTLIILEQRLTEVRYEIESYESRLRTMDDQIDYSTIYLSISEVEKYTPDPVVKRTVGERIAEGISESFHDVCEGLVDLFVTFVVGLPYIVAFLLVMGTIALIIYGIVRLIMHFSKKTEAKRIEKIRKRAEMLQNANMPVNPPQQVMQPELLPIPQPEQQIMQQPELPQPQEQQAEQPVIESETPAQNDKTDKA